VTVCNYAYLDFFCCDMCISKFDSLCGYYHICQIILPIYFCIEILKSISWLLSFVNCGFVPACTSVRVSKYMIWQRERELLLLVVIAVSEWFH